MNMNIRTDEEQRVITEIHAGKWWRHLLAGGIAGAVSRTCTAPLDRMKIYFQVCTEERKLRECFKTLIKEGGVTSLWRGNLVNVLKIAPESAIKFAAYEEIKKLIKNNDKRSLVIHERFFAGAIAGGISQSVIYPMEVLKTRLALRKRGQYSGIIDAARKMYYTEGLQCFYRGYVPNMLGVVPYAGIDLAIYETLKRAYLQTHAENQPLDIVVLLQCSTVSSSLGQIATYPLALIRTRLQVQKTNKNGKTMRLIFQSIIREQGVSGLYRGLIPNFIKVIPAVNITYFIYEYSSRLLGVNMS